MSDEPMSLNELPGYLKSVREHGQGDIPVVGVGRIVVSNKSGRTKKLAGAALICLFLTAAGTLTHAVMAPKNITIATNEDVGAAMVAGMVAADGSRVVSVIQSEDKTYKVRVVTFRSLSSLLESLRRNREFEKVEAE